MTYAQKWRDIPGFTGYQVSDLGQVRRGEKILRQHVAAKSGGLFVNLGRTTRLVHRLVLAAFEGSKRGEITHRNGDRRDNRLANLVYGRRDVVSASSRCSNGHELSGSNVSVWGSANRICVACRDGAPAVRGLPDVLK